MTRLNCWLALAALIVCGQIAAAQDEQTKAIVDKAVQALGGTDKQKLPGITLDATAKFKLDNNDFEFNSSWSGLGLDKAHANVEGGTDGKKKTVVMVMNGSQIWGQEGGKVEPVAAAIQPYLHGMFRSIRFAQRPGLLHDKAIKLSPLGEMVVNKTACLGVKVEQKDCRDVSLYFDKATGLAVKAEFPFKEKPDGPDVTFAFLFSDYKDFDGVKHFTKIAFQRDQQAQFEFQLSNIRLHATLNENLFMKP